MIDKNNLTLLTGGFRELVVGDKFTFNKDSDSYYTVTHISHDYDEIEYVFTDARGNKHTSRLDNLKSNVPFWVDRAKENFEAPPDDKDYEAGLATGYIDGVADALRTYEAEFGVTTQGAKILQAFLKKAIDNDAT